MALSDPRRPDPRHGRRRFRYGFVASSDGHKARPGTGYKQVERSMMTDAVGAPGVIVERSRSSRGAWRTPRSPSR